MQVSGCSGLDLDTIYDQTPTTILDPDVDAISDQACFILKLGHSFITNPTQ